ncbi:MAG: hypothetical protein HGA85_00330 [Nanoarchaeota archaeon]|nr:hypothetical protein [Nanoarchaeota archaeon]
MSVILYNDLKNMEFIQFYDHLLDSFINKLAFTRPLVLYLLFGPSESMFFYSGILLNVALLFFFYKSLKKIFTAEKAAIITIITCTQYFFLILLVSSYIDLTYFFLFSIYFVYLYDFLKNGRMPLWEFTLIVFLIYYARNMSHVLFPVVIATISVFLAANKQVKKAFPLIGSSIIGICLYFIIFFRADLSLFFSDIAAISADKFIDHSIPNVFVFIGLVYSYLTTNGIYVNLFMFMKTPSLLINLGIYLAVLYSAAKNRNKYWLWIFVAGELFFFIFFNLFYPYYEERYFLPFYLVYIVIAYDPIEAIVKRVSKISPAHICAIGVFIILTTSMAKAILQQPDEVNYSDKILNAKRLGSIKDMEGVEEGSRVYLSSSNRLYLFFWVNQIDIGGKKYGHLSVYDPRFKYTIVGSEQEADYILCDAECQSYKETHKDMAVALQNREFYLFRKASD